MANINSLVKNILEGANVRKSLLEASSNIDVYDVLEYFIEYEDDLVPLQQGEISYSSDGTVKKSGNKLTGSITLSDTDGLGFSKTLRLNNFVLSDDEEDDGIGLQAWHSDDASQISDFLIDFMYDLGDEYVKYCKNKLKEAGFDCDVDVDISTDSALDISGDLEGYVKMNKNNIDYFVLHPEESKPSSHNELEKPKEENFIKHYSGELGSFDYDERLFQPVRTRDYVGLRYIGGTNKPGKDIHIPKGVIDISGMFKPSSGWGGSSATTWLKTPPVIPQGVLYCYKTFEGCYSLEEPPVIPNGVKDCGSMFYGCKKLKYAPIIPPSVEETDYMFGGCSEEVQEAGEWNIAHRGQSYYDQN